MKTLTVFGLACLCLFLTACDRTTSDAQRIQISGSSTLAPLIGELANRFEKRGVGLRLDVQTGGSSRGIQDVRKGLSRIGMVSRALGQHEKDLYGFPVALDGIAIVVHRSNPVEELTKTQLTDIYQGRINDWSTLSTQSGPIHVIHKADGRSTQDVFLSYTALKTNEVKANTIIGDNEQAIKLVTHNPAAIAYVSIGTAQYHARQGANLKLLIIDGVEPEMENILNGRYPISRQLNLITKNKPDGALALFLDFTRSPTAKAIIKEFYFVPYEH